MIALIAATLLAQQPLHFEVASIRPSPKPTVVQANNGTLRIGIRLDGARFEHNYANLFDLVTNAYDVKHYQVTGPDWMAESRWDVQAVLPEKSQPNQVHEMMRSLLEERFRLKAHVERKDQPAYALTVDKGGPAFKEFDPDRPKSTVPRIASPDFVQMDLQGTTMDDLAAMLTNWTDRPVVDATGLKGKYELVLEVSSADLAAPMNKRGSGVLVIGEPGPLPTSQPDSSGRPAEAASSPTGSSLTTSVQKLGLKLVKQRMPIKQVVVDYIERVPTDN